jgi:hypothetical protein
LGTGFDPLGVVTTTSAGPAVYGPPKGIRAVIVVALTDAMVAATPPMVTNVVGGTVREPKLLPLIVTDWPPVSGPLAGLIAVTVGTSWYVYPLTNLPVPPFVVVTATLCGPATTYAGVVAMIVDALTDTMVAATPPMVTNVVGGTVREPKKLPLIVTDWPPNNGPLAGTIVATFGPAT